MSPKIACVMLYSAARPTWMVDQARACFRRQTYPNRVLVEIDTTHMQTFGLCEMMNVGMQQAIDENPDAEYLAKWDSDDWSSAYRLEDQYKRIIQTGALVTGYHTMPFVSEGCPDCTAWPVGGPTHDCERCHGTGREVLLYSNPQSRSYALGTSLFMTVESFKRFPFPSTVSAKNPRGLGADTALTTLLASHGVLASVSAIQDIEKGFEGQSPLMIARIHGGNASINASRGGFRQAEAITARLARLLMSGERR